MGTGRLVMHIGKVLSVTDPFAVIEVLQLPVLHDPDQVADIRVGKVENTGILMKNNRHLLFSLNALPSS